MRKLYLLVQTKYNKGVLFIRYFGGKTRTCKQIVEILNTYRKDGQVFLSPFVGGAWVESLLSSPKECYDKHPYLIAMYKELQKGWLPPTTLTKEEYDYIKNNPDEKPYLTGFVGFGCSFAGKWFGGYAKDSSDRNYCMNAYNSILKKLDNLKDTYFDCKDYQQIEPKGYLIYCDPPYEGTTQYSKTLVGDFNSKDFWDLMRQWSIHNTVIISEYNAPEDFKCIWSQEVKLDMRDSENKKKVRVEKLFTINNI